MPYCCDKTCLLLTPQLFVKGKSFSLSLTFLAHSLKNKGSPEDLEQTPGVRMFREGSTACFPGTGRGLGCCEQHSPPRRWHGCRVSGAESGRNAPGPGEGFTGGRVGRRGRAGPPAPGLPRGGGHAGGGPEGRAAAYKLGSRHCSPSGKPCRVPRFVLRQQRFPAVPPAPRRCEKRPAASPFCRGCCCVPPAPPASSGVRRPCSRWTPPGISPSPAAASWGSTTSAWPAACRNMPRSWSPTPRRCTAPRPGRSPPPPSSAAPASVSAGRARRSFASSLRYC